jgi:hypothetical protein
MDRSEDFLMNDVDGGGASDDSTDDSDIGSDSE